jgi:hypothetical protein
MRNLNLNKNKAEFDRAGKYRFAGNEVNKYQLQISFLSCLMGLLQNTGHFFRVVLELDSL